MLLSDSLTVWDIAFRWAAKDPDRYWFRLPADVRDNCRLLVDAVLKGELPCITLRLEKWQPEDGEEYRNTFIRHHWGALEDCLAGKSYDKKFLQHGLISRYEFYQWCVGWGIEPPAFWFPPGAKLGFEPKRPLGDPETDEDEPNKRSGRPAQRARVACQVIAGNLWKGKPDMTIAAMVKHEAIQQLGGGAHYAEQVVRRWVKEAAPTEVREKRGRPAKKKGTPDRSAN